jgi:hypothetical protein
VATSDVRITNLLLLRHLHGSQTNLVTSLAPKFSAVTLKGMVGGHTKITDEAAREIEAKLNLPSDWMDRDNEGLIWMSKINYELHGFISALPPSEKERLKQLLLGAW